VKTEGSGLPSEYLGEYKILKEDPSELAALDDAALFFKRANRAMTASLRPIYVKRTGTGNASTTIVIFHEGARWAMAKINEMKKFTDPSLGKDPKESQLTKFFQVQKKMTDACVRACILVHACINMCRYMQTFHIDAYTHSFMHICIHAHTDTYIVGDLLPSAESSHV
jgi:hypothetical protein